MELEVEYMIIYWISMIIQNFENTKPWLCSVSDGYTSLDEAKKAILDARKKFRVLSAWINTFPESVNITVFHECYIDAFGNIK